MALTSVDTKHLRDFFHSMLDLEHKQKLEEFEKSHITGNISWLALISEDGDAGYDESTKNMQEKWGLNQSQVTKLVEEFFNLTTKMKKVKIDVNIENPTPHMQVHDISLYKIP